MHNVSFRELTPHDIDFTFDVKRQSLGPYVDATWGWNDQKEMIAHNREFITQDGQVIRYYSEDVGYIVCDRSKDYHYLAHFYIMPQYQGLGIGKHVIRTVCDDANEKCKDIRLLVLKNNERAIRFYEDLGFTVSKEIATHLFLEKRFIA